MTPNEIKAVLRGLLETRLPGFLWGPPGIGKSSIVRQVSGELGYELIDVRAVLLDPVDLRGLPSINGDNRAHWCPPAFLPHKEDAKCIILLDELPQAPPLVQSACLQLVLDRRLGEYVLPDQCVTMAAGNRQEDRTGAHRMITSLSNRFACHMDLEVNNDEWQDWALDNGIIPEVRSYLHFRPAHLFQFDPNSGARAFATPRSWEFVSKLLPRTPSGLEHHVICGSVGEGLATEFLAFRNTYDKLPDPDKILASPETSDVPTELSVLYALCGALVDRVKKKDKKETKRLDAVSIYAGRLQQEFAVLLMKESARANPNLLRKSQAAKDWASDHADLLLGRES